MTYSLAAAFDAYPAHEYDGGISLRSWWYAQAMEHLVEVVQHLSRATDLAGLMAVIRLAACDLTGADGATFVLRKGEHCYYAEENAIAPLWKGQMFPLQACISGWVMVNGKPAIIEDIYEDSRIPVDAYRQTFVKSLAMVPIRRQQPIAAIGNYWASYHRPSEEEVAVLQALANVTAVAMENVELSAELRRKVEALEASNRELSQFAWAASHDLKSPLRAIDNLSSWISQALWDGAAPETRDHLAKLRGRVRRMEKLMDEFLDYASVGGSGRPPSDQLVDGDRIKEELLGLLNIPPNFTVSFSPAFAAVRVPRLQLQRVLFNLLDNAIRHHDRNAGIVKVDAGIEEDTGLYVFTVADDGPGIPAQFHDKIFAMFRTLRPVAEGEGSGTGLSLVKRILTVHGGSIEIASGQGRGSTFRFTWPRSSTD
jgi:signal transduction histidine kinase